MKEITRIHIAKVAYDIELGAKRDIEQYMTALERYASDAEIMDDIEIRVTELLSEHGVSTGGVITAADVAAVRAQLGEPSDFAAAEIEAGVDSVPADSAVARRVYRDEDEAVLGGVLAGFAKYFGIDPLWVRLIFLVVLIISFGTALVVYLILWLIIPPAETAADKLRMSGKPVTLGSIKELVRREERVGGEKSQVAKRVMSAIGGWLLVLMAIGGLVAIAAVVSSLVFGFAPSDVMYMNESWWFLSALGLAVLSGLLFSALCLVLASAAFRRAWTSRIGVAVGSLVAAGLIVFSGAVGLGMYGYADEQSRIDNLFETRRIESMTDIKNIKNMKIEASGNDVASANIEYIVAARSRIELAGLPGVEPVISVSNDGMTMTVKMKSYDEEERYFWGYRPSPTLKIYGPALESIALNDIEQSVSYRSRGSQDTVSISVEAGSFSLEGVYKKVQVSSKDRASVRFDEATIEDLTAYLSGGTLVAGVVRTLTVEQADVCPARDYYDDSASLSVQAVSSGEMVYNGTRQAAETIFSDCGGIVIGDDTDSSGDEY